MKRTSKKLLSVVCTSALVISLVACGSKDTTTSEYVDTTITGQITAIDGDEVTLQLGELSEASGDSNAPSDMEKPDDTNSDGTSDGSTSQNSDSNQPPEMPSDDANSSDANAPQNSDGNQPPAKPDDANSDTTSDGSTSQNSDNNQPPAKPDDANSDTTSDDSTSQNSDGNQPPEMPSGEAGGSSQTFTAGDDTTTVDLSDAEITEDSETITIDDLEKNDVLEITFDSNGNATSVTVVTLSSGKQSGFGGSGQVNQGSAATTIDSDGTYSDESYESTGDDENALRVDGATVTLDGITVNKSAGSSSNTEDGDFYGMNAALLATNGATVTIKDATITSSAQNGNGVFSYGEGTTVNISNSKITTSADNSGGIQTTGGATTNAKNLTVETSGNSSAAIRSDRGGGTVNVKKGTYTSNGYNSPAVYSTADITVADATLTANNSEALVIEGENSITLTDCDVTGNMSDTKGTSSDENVHNVMIYQSMSGDAEEGTSSFSMTGGSLVSKNGDMFYVTNTNCVLKLSGVDITNEDSDAYLLNICGNSASHGWGTAGSNGANVTFTADGQTLEGNIIVDTISTLNMTLTGKSNFTGTINIVDNAQGGTAVSDNAVVTIDKGSTWTLTGNCTLTSLTNNGTINFNGYTITLADGTVLK